METWPPSASALADYIRAQLLGLDERREIAPSPGSGSRNAAEQLTALG
jgi:hypothetical protein